jgi:hypothetical protein
MMTTAIRCRWQRKPEGSGRRRSPIFPTSKIRRAAAASDAGAAKKEVFMADRVSVSISIGGVLAETSAASWSILSSIRGFRSNGMAPILISLSSLTMARFCSTRTKWHGAGARRTTA